MTDWEAQVFLAEEIANALARKQQPLAPIAGPAPPVNVFALELVPTAPVKPAQTMEEWLLSGPDDYDTVDDTITSTQESTYRYGPMLLWALVVTNNAASGGPNLLLRFTTDHGRTGQYKIPATKSVSFNDIKGGYGSEFRVVTDGTSAEMIVQVSLKHPFNGV